MEDAELRRSGISAWEQWSLHPSGTRWVLCIFEAIEMPSLRDSMGAVFFKAIEMSSLRDFAFANMKCVFRSLC